MYEQPMILPIDPDDETVWRERNSRGRESPAGLRLRLIVAGIKFKFLRSSTPAREQRPPANRREHDKAIAQNLPGQPREMRQPAPLRRITNPALFAHRRGGDCGDTGRRARPPGAQKAPAVRRAADRASRAATRRRQTFGRASTSRHYRAHRPGAAVPFSSSDQTTRGVARVSLGWNSSELNSSA